MERIGLEWLININPNHIGVFNIVFTFNQTGYQVHSLSVVLKINTTLTNLLIGGDDQFKGNGSTLSVFYHNGTKDNLSILLTLNDTIYNQILNNSYLITPDTDQIVN
jgi:hypothetical protein